MALPRGIYYKVLKQGDPEGSTAQLTQHRDGHYTGWTINGKKFDSSRGGTPFAMRLSDLMMAGLLPCSRCTWATSGNFTSQPKMGYGKFSQPGIPGGSTLIFEVELLGVG